MIKISSDNNDAYEPKFQEIQHLRAFHQTIYSYGIHNYDEKCNLLSLIEIFEDQSEAIKDNNCSQKIVGIDEIQERFQRNNVKKYQFDEIKGFLLSNKKQLGGGTEADVFQHTETDSKQAMKIFKKINISDNLNLSRPLKDIAILSLGFEYFPKLSGYSIAEHTNSMGQKQLEFILLMEMSEYDLLSIGYNLSPDRFFNIQNMSYFQCCGIIIDCLWAYQTLHFFQIIHADASLNNILLTKEYSSKLCDFGCSIICQGKEELKKLESNNPLFTAISYQPGYTPPQFFKEGQYGYMSDQYSFGRCVEVLIQGKQTHNDEYALDKINNKIFKNKLENFIKECTNHDLNERGSFEKSIKEFESILQAAIYPIDWQDKILENYQSQEKKKATY